MERLRAEGLAKTQVETEQQVLRAKAEAEAAVAKAEGEATARKRAADAALYTAQKEAEGVAASLAAQVSLPALRSVRVTPCTCIRLQAHGLQSMVRAFSGDSRALLSYMMLDKDL